MAKYKNPGPNDPKDFQDSKGSRPSKEKIKNLKDQEEIQNWLTRISSSNHYRKHISEKFRWADLIEEYRGSFRSVQEASDIYIPALNLIFAYVKSEIPSLYLRDPKIKVNPKKGSSVTAAKIVEKALNYLWRTKRLKRENKKNIFDDLLVGHSWFKTGYTGKFGTIEEGNQTYEFIEDEDFFGYRIPYENITFNPDSQDPPYDCSWIAHEVWLTKEEAESNTSFDKNALKDVNFAVVREADRQFKTTIDHETNLRQDPIAKKAKFYEIWDKTTKLKCVIAEGVFSYICPPKEWPYDMRGFPFSFLRLNEDPLNPYGIPDCYMFESLVLELMKLQAAWMDHVKRYNRQLLYREGALSDDALNQFAQGITGAAIPVQTGDKPLGDIVAPIPYPQLQTDIYGLEVRLKEYIGRISGQSGIDQGGVQQTTTRSLGEINKIQEGGQNRRSDKIDTIEDFVEDIAGNLVALLQQLADLPYFVRIAGDDVEPEVPGIAERPSASMPGAITEPKGFTFTKEDIQGEFDFEVVAGSTKPLDQTQKLDLLQFIAEALPKLGAIPGGPVTTYLGLEIADEIDLPGLKRAIVEEQKMAKEQQQAQEKQQQEMVQLQMAQEGAELQIKAEREATKQGKLELEGIKTIHEIRNPKSDKPVQ